MDFINMAIIYYFKGDIPCHRYPEENGGNHKIRIRDTGINPNNSQLNLLDITPQGCHGKVLIGVEDGVGHVYTEHFKVEDKEGNIMPSSITLDNAHAVFMIARRVENGFHPVGILIYKR